MTDARKRQPGARCRAKTRRGTVCIRRPIRNGRCANHGGMSTGPKTAEGKARIALAQHRRWVAAKAAALCAGDNIETNTCARASRGF
jgi:hypothetical protein